MDTKELARLKELAQNATPGPWHSCFDPHSNMIECKNCEWVMGLDEDCRCPFIVNPYMPDELSDTRGYLKIKFKNIIEHASWIIEK